MNDKHTHNKSYKLLKNLFDGFYQGKYHDIVLGWFAMDENREEKDAAIDRLADEQFKSDKHPDRESYKMLYDWKRRRGISTRTGLRMPLRHRLGVRVAAVVVPFMILAGAAWSFLSSPGSVEAPQVVMVAMKFSDKMGAPKRTSLADGSHLLVRPGSKILRAKDFGKNRLISMSGEAYFDVERDTLRRFTVQTPHLNVNVLGTQFNVEADENSPYTVVTLYRGRIVVDGMKCEGKEPVELAPGQRMVYENATCEYRIEPVCGNVPDWIAERLIFDNTHYDEVFRIYEWYYGVKIEVAGRLAHESFRYRLLGDEPVSRAMSILKEMKDNFTYTIDGDTVKITAKR